MRQETRRMNSDVLNFTVRAIHNPVRAKNNKTNSLLISPQKTNFSIFMIFYLVVNILIIRPVYKILDSIAILSLILRYY